MVSFVQALAAWTAALHTRQRQENTHSMQLTFGGTAWLFHYDEGVVSGSYNTNRLLVSVILKHN